MLRLFLVGGTGATALRPTAGIRRHAVDTPYGPPSGEVVEFDWPGARVFFLPRHGPAATLPPHCVNYRANVWAARYFDPELVVGINAVGGIAAAARPARLVVPDQLVDYTWGREQSFADGADTPVLHVDFTEPFAAGARARLLEAAGRAGVDVLDGATYGVTQGPRLETAAEIDRLERDGCDIVGMTAMPEAGLARELGLDYAILAVVVNRAAGRGDGTSIHAELERHVAAGMAAADGVLRALAPASRGRPDGRR